MAYPTDFEDEERTECEAAKREREIDKADYERDRKRDDQAQGEALAYALKCGDAIDEAYAMTPHGTSAETWLANAKDHLGELVKAIKQTDSRPFAAWLDKNCDFKRRHVSPAGLTVLNGRPFECDFWHFVIKDHDDGETPAMAIKVGHEERSNYMDVELEHYRENGELEAACLLGLFGCVEDLESILKVLVRANR